jgi:hypothetical protein
MKPIIVLGVAIIVFGVAALLYQQFTYTARETVVDIGPIHATADRKKTVLLPPLVGIAALVSGVVLVAVGMRKRA